MKNKTRILIILLFVFMTSIAYLLSVYRTGNKVELVQYEGFQDTSGDWYAQFYIGEDIYNSTKVEGELLHIGVELGLISGVSLNGQLMGGMPITYYYVLTSFSMALYIWFACLIIEVLLLIPEMLRKIFERI